MKRLIDGKVVFPVLLFLNLTFFVLNLILLLIRLSGLTFAEALTTAVTLMSGLVISGAAVWGVLSWRKRLKGSTRHAFAHKLLDSIVEVVAAINYLRQPATGGAERLIALDAELDKQRKEGRRTSLKGELALSNLASRIDAINKNFDAFELGRYKARILFGPEATEHFQPLHDCIFKLMHSLREFQNQEYLETLKPEEKDHLQRTVWASGTKTDKFSADMEEACKKAITYLRRHL